MRQEQLREADRLAAAFPQSDDALYLVGIVHYEQGDWKKATEYWERALALDPSRADTCSKLGYAFFISESFDKAEALLRKALAIDPSFAEPYEHLGSLLMKRGRMDDAIAVLSSATTRTAQIERALGQAYQHLQNYAKAKEHYEAALRLKPDYREVYYSLATICARLGDKAAAETHRAKFSALQAEIQQHSRRIRSALDLAAIAKRSMAKTHTDVGRVWLVMGKPEEAERLWRRAADVDAASVESRAFLAMRCQKTGRDAEAVTRYQELAAIEPENGSHFFNLGMLHIRLGQADAAQAVLTRLTTLAPERPEGHAALAQALNMAGNVEGAIAELERAIALDPANTRYQQLREGLTARK